MWGEYGYFEGEQLGKARDLSLLGRLLIYARPYWAILALTCVLITGATAAGLVLPYLTKLAIDRYIVVSVQEVRLKPEMGDRSRAVLARWRHLLHPTGLDHTFFLSGENARRIDPVDLEHLKTAGLILQRPYYLLEKETGPAREVVHDRPDLFRIFPEVAVIAQPDLARLSHAELTKLRSADVAGLAWIALICGLILVAGYLFECAHVLLLEYTGQRVTHDLRQNLMTHIVGQSMAFHDQYTSGRLVARVTNDIQNLTEMIKSVAVTLFKDIFILIGIIILLVHINLRLALLTLTLMPPIILVTMICRRLARDAFRELRAKVALINSAFAETMGGIRIIQIFRREALNRRFFAKLNHENYLAGMRQIKIFAVFMPLIEVFSAMALGLILWYGGLSVIKETMTLGAVVAFIGYIRKFFEPIRDLSEKFNILQSAMASLERIFGLLDRQSALPQAESPKPVPGKPGDLEFDQVNFAYANGEPVLHDVSFRVAKGETLAIIGATGAGKTSIINLLLRFYDPTSGRVLVDGVDVRELDLSEHRARIGLVMQDVFLFAGTARDNIALAHENISMDRIESAARAVNAYQFLETLPDGLDQVLGEGGATLSLGQRQILAFARVLAHDPQILVLDEATAFIDSESEKLIEEALERITFGRTSIIIAHRLSTIRRADRILVLHQGRITETGTHEELMARRGMYFNLQQLQTREFRSDIVNPSG